MRERERRPWKEEVQRESPRKAVGTGRAGEGGRTCIPTNVMGEMSLMKGKPDCSARLAHKAVLPAPGGPSTRIEMSEVRSDVCNWPSRADACPHERLARGPFRSAGRLEARAV